ncbi:MAG: DUF393 domain-containing protein [Nitrospinae bacterium]|nr:DUF393 domain-containing protein [Nitrospinota bacterium]
MPEKAVILFDSVCNLCLGAVTFAITHAPRAGWRVAPLQSEEGARILADCGLPAIHSDSIVFCDGGKCLTKSEAMIAIAERLSGPWRALALARVAPRPARDWLYDFVARNRYWLFGKRDVCAYLPMGGAGGVYRR